MISVKKLNNDSVWINPDLLRLIETLPDTMLTFSDGTRLMVQERPDEIVARIIEFRRRIPLALSEPFTHPEARI